jgi:hypothetical protein
MGMGVHQASEPRSWKTGSRLRTISERQPSDVARTRTIIQASHRWTPGAPDPVQFAPGDVLALRYFATDPLVRQALRILHSLQDPPTAIQLRHRRAELQQRVRYSLSLAQVQLEAATYFLPVDSAIGILASAPPTDHLVDAIRLPFPAVSIYFGADLAIDQRFIRWSDGHLTQRPQTAQAMAELYTRPGEIAATQDIVLTVRELGGYLSGVTLQADGDGRLADHALWIVATNPTPNASQLAQPAWRGFASTTCDTPRPPCPSRPVPVPGS